MLILYFKRAKLKVKVYPKKRWLFEDIYSKDIVVQVTNIGFEKTEVSDISIVLRKGSESIRIKDVLTYKRIESIGSKSTISLNVSFDSIIENSNMYNYSLVRASVHTPTGKIYNSNWMLIDEAKTEWDHNRS